MQSNSKFGFKDTLVILLSIALVAVVFLYFAKKQEHNSIVTEINNEKDSIKVELTNMLINYDSLKTNNDRLNQNLLFTQTEIKNLLVELDQVKRASVSEVSNYKDKVNTLRGIMKNLYNQIDSLNERNKILYAENVQVKQRYTDEKSKNEVLVKEKDELVQTVKRAQILEAVDLKITGLNPRDKETDRIARTKKIMISLSLSKNLTASRGAKDIYVRIMRPDQLLLVTNPSDVFNFEDMQIPYSAKREVNYEGSELPVNIYWDNTGHDPLIPGIYTVDVFADGYNIGTSKYLFKK
jgi:predicted  nucleic acid-binding Zn-ribbon protein